MLLYDTNPENTTVYYGRDNELCSFEGGMYELKHEEVTKSFEKANKMEDILEIINEVK